MELEKEAERSTEEKTNLKQSICIEEKKIWRVAFPTMLSKATLFGTLVVTQAFIGHIGPLQLAAYSFTQIIAVRFGQGTLAGMASATETLCGQAYGAKQYHMMGIYLQRSWIINFATATLLAPIFIFAPKIFKFLGQKEDMAKESGHISLWFILYLYSLVFNQTIQKFLQAQTKNMIVGWLSVISFLLHLLLSWIFVIELKLGIAGAMGAVITSSWFVVIGSLIYVFGGWCSHTWTGFSIAAFSDLFSMLKLSLSSGIMICLELWYYAILVLVAGYMKNAKTAISAFSICLNITAWNLMLFMGFASSSSVRMGNELGKGDAKAAKFSLTINLITALGVGVLFCIMCLAFGRKIGYIFTKDEPVVDYVSSLSILLAFSLLLNSLQVVLSGAAIGAGRQSTVAYVNVFCYYVFGVPLGLVLGFVAHLQVKGFWIGMVLGVVLQVVLLGYITKTTNWDKQVKKANDRLNRYFKPSIENCNE